VPQRTNKTSPSQTSQRFNWLILELHSRANKISHRITIDRHCREKTKHRTWINAYDVADSFKWSRDVTLSGILTLTLQLTIRGGWASTLRAQHRLQKCGIAWQSEIMASTGMKPFAQCWTCTGPQPGGHSGGGPPNFLCPPKVCCVRKNCFKRIIKTQILPL